MDKRFIKSQLYTDKEKEQHEIVKRIYGRRHMIKRRQKKIETELSEMDEIDKQIQKLKREKSKHQTVINRVKKEITTHRKEITEWSTKLFQLYKKGELEYLPTFNVKRKTKGGNKYWEGMIIPPKKEGKRGKKYYRTSDPFGSETKVIKRYEEETGESLEGKSDNFIHFTLSEWLKPQLVDYWFQRMEI